MEAIWTPQPKQALMMEWPEYKALYGCAAGGGKEVDFKLGGFRDFRE